jgi:hypothetical protein
VAGQTFKQFPPYTLSFRTAEAETQQENPHAVFL